MGVGERARRWLVVGAAVVFALGYVAPVARGQTPVQDGPPICGLEAGTGPIATDDGTLRVGTYNVLHTQGEYDDETLDRRVELIVEALADSETDVVGLQEVVRSANHGNVAQRIAAGLAARTGQDWSWCFNQSNPHVPGEPDSGPGGIGGPASQVIAGAARAGDSPWAEGVAVVSRLPISDQATHRLPPRTAEAPVCQAEQPDDPLAFATCAFDTRQILWARVGTGCGEMDFVSTHLANDESSISEQSRLLQITDALAQIDQLASVDAAPDVLVGDLNTLEGSPVWQAAIDAGFVDGFRAASPDEPGFTSSQEIDAPSATVEQRIDYVLARPGSTPLAPADAEILGDESSPFQGSGGQTVVWPSDHYGVALTLLDESACVASEPPVGPPTGVPSAESAAAGSRRQALPATGGGFSPVLGLAFLAGAALVSRARRQPWRARASGC